MDLRDKLDWDNRIEDLDDLLEEPFEIDAEKDFPLMCVVSYNIRTRHRVESLRGLKLSEYERDLLEYFIAYDYSPTTKLY